MWYRSQPYAHPDIPTNEESQPSVHLQQGSSYLVEFNRSGAQIYAGVMDSSYEGVIGAMLTVANVAGMRVYKDARLAQMIVHELSEPTEGYSGRYQGRGKL
ncbi:hypothetical protein B7494_g931 [Chlorociboria aeruginascens]|nr:hypothetical protein B7494_g931 [Chlorociboria aeruginascens]